MKLGVQVGLGPGHNVLDGDSAPPPLNGHSPSLNFPSISAVATWLDGLGMEVGLGPGDFVLHGDPARLPKKEAEPGGGTLPQFAANVYCGQTAGWITMALGMEVGLALSSPHCARWGHSSPPQKRGQSSPQFRPILIVAKRLDASRCHLVWR